MDFAWILFAVIIATPATSSYETDFVISFAADGVKDVEKRAIVSTQLTSETLNKDDDRAQWVS